MHATKANGLRGRLAQAVGCVAIVGSAFVIGWNLSGGHRPANEAVAAPPAVQPQAPAAGSAAASDYAQRVVGYIYGNVAVTREQLGEYLIARYGEEKLPLLLNKLIIDHACQEKGIEVTAAEVEAALDYDLKEMKVDKKAFFQNLLKQYKKSEYEWKEDVIRPRLLLTKLCQQRVRVTDEDVQKAFEAQYGEKVDVRIILYPPDQQKFLSQLYDQARKSEDDFIELAKKQPDSNLALTAGRIEPIGKHSNMEEVEKVAFSLKAGQISHVIQVKEGWLLIWCCGRVPAQNVPFEEKQAELHRRVFDKKLQEEIPKAFTELAKQAQAQRFLKGRETQEEMERETKQMIQGSSGPVGQVRPK